MSKPATLWITRNGSDTVTAANAGFSLLLETGDNLLLETGFNFLLEDTVVTPKYPATWTVPDKIRTSWEARDGYSTLAVVTADNRVTEALDNRVTEAGDQRTTEVVTLTKKKPTEWTEG